MVIRTTVAESDAIRTAIAEYDLPLRTRTREDGLVIECAFAEPAHDVGRAQREAVYFLMRALGQKPVAR